MHQEIIVMLFQPSLEMQREPTYSKIEVETYDFQPSLEMQPHFITICLCSRIVSFQPSLEMQHADLLERFQNF